MSAGLSLGITPAGEKMVYLFEHRVSLSAYLDMSLRPGCQILADKFSERILVQNWGPDNLAKLFKDEE